MNNVDIIKEIEKDENFKMTPQRKQRIVNMLNEGIENTLYKNNNLKEISEAKKVDLSWKDDKTYKVVTSEKDIKAIFSTLMEIHKTAPNTLIGFDTETTGLQVNGNYTDILVGLTLSYAKNTGFYFPINHINMENIELETEMFMRILKAFICVEGNYKLPLVTHNGKFDYKVMKHYNIDLNIQEDTYIKHSLMKNTDSKTFGSLKIIAKEKLGIDVVELTDMYVNVDNTTIEIASYLVENGYLNVNEITKGKLKHKGTFKSLLAYDFRFASKDFVELYGSADGDFPLQILELQNEEWEESMNMIYQLELKTIKTLAEQEYYGITIDTEGIIKEGELLEKELENLENEIFEDIGRRFSLTSNVQLGEYIYGELGIPINPKFKTSKGVGQVNNTALKYFAKTKNEDGSIAYPVIEKILKHKKLTKRISDFFKKLPQLEVKGKLNPSYNQLGTDTGRISCKEPNIQQTEQGIRAYMTTDTEDDYMIVCDYSQVEYRLLGGLADEPNISEFFTNNEDADIHTLSFANMNNVPYNTVTSSQRSIGKVLNFGTVYGLQDESLSAQLNNGHTSVLHQQMANESRRKYFEGIPNVSNYFNKIREEAKKTKKITTFFGRTRHIEEFNKPNATQAEIASGERKVTNTNIQGTGADILKIAMVRIRELLNKHNIPMDDVQMRINVHDEIALHCNKKYNPYFILTIMREAMELDLAEYGIPPLYIGATIGSSWGECGNEDLELPVGLLKELTLNGTVKHQKIIEGISVTEHKQDWKDKLEEFYYNKTKEEITRMLKQNKPNKQDKYLTEIIEELFISNKSLKTILEAKEILNKSTLLYNNILHLLFILTDKDIVKYAKQSIVFGSKLYDGENDLLVTAYSEVEEIDVPKKLLLMVTQFIIKHKLIEGKGLTIAKRSYIKLDKVENYFKNTPKHINKLKEYVDKYINGRYHVVEDSLTNLLLLQYDEYDEMVSYIKEYVILQDDELMKVVEYIVDNTYDTTFGSLLNPVYCRNINTKLKKEAIELYEDNLNNSKGVNRILFTEEINTVLNGNTYSDETEESYGLWKTYNNTNIFSKNTPYKLSDSVIVDEENKEVHLNFTKANSEAIDMLLKIAISHNAMRSRTDDSSYANELLTPVINYGIYDNPHKVVGYGLLNNPTTFVLFDSIINEDYTELGIEFDYEGIVKSYTEKLLIPFNCKYIK